MDEITVLIADDHTLFRKGIQKMLEAEPDMRVIGEAATGREALDQARQAMPDIVLMDIKMPDPSTGVGPALDGIEATRQLRREMPHVGIIFVTMFQDDEFILRGLQAGGRGYILKDADPETMLRAIRAVAHGESLLSPAIAQKVLGHFMGPAGDLSSGRAPLVDDLSDRERQVLSLIAQGCSNKEIAAQLSISEKTVKNHIANIFAKLHIGDRTRAALYAIRKGLVKL